MCKRTVHLWAFVSILVLLSGPAGGETLLDYDFSDGSGTTVTDLTGNGNDGTLVGFADTSAGGGVFDGREGWVDGGGLCFLDDDVRSYVETPLNLDSLPGDFTVEFEANYSGASGWTPAIGSDATGCCAESFFFGINSNQSNLEVRLQDSGGPAGNHPWTSVPSATKHHLALVYDASTDGIEVFVDGVSVATGTRGAADMGGVSTQFLIGNTGWSAGEQWDGVIFGVAVSNEKLEPGSFAIPNRPVPEASDPDPEDGAMDVLRDIVLSWMPGESAETHDVYFGTNPEDVANADRGNPLDVLASEGQSEIVYDSGLLNFGETYFWRVDEVGAVPGTVFTGPVWDFTVEAYLFTLGAEQISVTASSVQKPEMGPEKTIDGSGLDEDGLHSTEETDMWLSGVAGPEAPWLQYEFDATYKLSEMRVWNYNAEFETALGFGLKDVTVEYSVDGADWTVLDGVGQFVQGPAEEGYAYNTVVDFGGVPARFVRLTADSNYDSHGQYGLSEVRFLYVPARARGPQPEAGEVDVDPSVELVWLAGREAATHELYVSSDPNAIVDGTALVATLDDRRYDAAALDLQLDQTYYWMIVEVNETEVPSRWESDVWSFTTVESLIVEDFEDYTDQDDAGEAIFQTWIDGFDDQNNGSLVGYELSRDGTFGETQIVHGGSQSMPLSYDNTDGVTDSRAERTFADAQDWTRHGIETLVLYFRGEADNMGGQMYVAINDEKVYYDGDADAKRRPLWTAWPVDLGTVDADLENVRTLAIGVEGANATGTIYVDDIALHREAPQGPQDPGTDNLVAHYAMDNSAEDLSGNGNDGVLSGGAAFRDDPFRGTVLSLDGVDGVVEVPHSAEIGLNESTDVTVTMWTMPANLPRANWTGLIAKNRDVSPGDAYGVWISNTNDWHFRVGTVSGNANVPGAPEPTEEWHFVAMTHDASTTTLRGYVDGRMVYENTNAAPAPLTAESPLWIGGAQSVTEYYPGLIDGVRIYDRALSEAELSFVGAQ